MSRLHLPLDFRRGLYRLIKGANTSNCHQRPKYEKAFLKNYTNVFDGLPGAGALQKITGRCYCQAKRKNVDELTQRTQQSNNVLDTPLPEATVPPREKMATIPNILCVARIGMTPFIANMIIHSQYEPAIGLVVIAGVTDLLDGWIARVVPGQSTVMGSFLDPLADKILVGTLFLSLTYVSLIPVPLTALIVGRDVILIAFGFYVRYLSLDPPKTFTRYFNVTLPTAQLAPTFISKVNTGLQLSVIGATLASTVVTSVDLHPYLQILWYTTAATTIASAVHYCFAKNTVKMLRQTAAKMKLNAREKKS